MEYCRDNIVSDNGARMECTIRDCFIFGWNILENSRGLKLSGAHCHSEVTHIFYLHNLFLIFLSEILLSRFKVKAFSLHFRIFRDKNVVYRFNPKYPILHHSDTCALPFKMFYDQSHTCGISSMFNVITLTRKSTLNNCPQ